MKSAYFAKATVLLVVHLLVSSATYLSAEENEDSRDIAERFVRQIEGRDTNAILHSYPMTYEFRAAMPNADTVIGWAREINRLFGRLGDVVNSEIVEHPDLGLRSVYFYYQGTKRPAKIWVTFSETTIAGFHYNIWTEGYAERKRTRVWENMSVVEYIFWGVLLVSMLIGSLFLLNGKGAFLIAGYNLMSKKEQAKYDEKALCRFTGMVTLWMTCCMALFPISILIGVTWVLYCAVGITTVSAVVFLIYANTGNRFLKKGVEEEKYGESFLGCFLYSRSVQWIAGILFFGLLFGGVPGLFWLGEREPTVRITDSGIRISGMYGVKIGFTEIIDISLMADTINAIPREFGGLRRTNGYDSGRTQKGYWSNEHSRVLLFTRRDSSPTIHIRRGDNEDVFLNFRDSEATRTLYNDMKTAFAR